MLFLKTFPTISIKGENRTRKPFTGNNAVSKNKKKDFEWDVKLQANKLLHCALQSIWGVNQYICSCIITIKVVQMTQTTNTASSILRYVRGFS